jgi:hypothetical protein
MNKQLFFSFLCASSLVLIPACCGTCGKDKDKDKVTESIATEQAQDASREASTTEVAVTEQAPATEVAVADVPASESSEAKI